MLQHRLLFFKISQPVQNYLAHAVQIGDLVINLTNLTAGHVLSNTEHFKLVFH